MTESHIPFEKISALLDDDIQIADERREIDAHRFSCAFCNEEFERLRRMLAYCSSMQTYIVCADGFAEQTIRAIRLLENDPHAKHRFAEQAMKVIPLPKRRKTFMKYIPAVAASVIAVSCLALFAFNSRQPDVPMVAVTHNHNLTDSKLTDAEIINMLMAADTYIRNISSNTIECEAKKQMFEAVSQDLERRKIRYTVKLRSPEQIWKRPANGFLTTFEEENTPLLQKVSSAKTKNNDIVTFTVFKKN